MTENDPQPGIKADSIKARNVVRGAQVHSDDPKAAAHLAPLAREIRLGQISAGTIEAENLVEGLQYLGSPSTATLDDLRKEVASLRERLQAVAAEGSIDPGDDEDARQAVAEAEAELAKPRPQGSRVIRRLRQLSDILIQGADASEAAGRIGTQVAKLAPVAAVALQVAQRLLGG